MVKAAANGTRSSASASRISARRPGLAIGYSPSRLPLPVNGGGFANRRHHGRAVSIKLRPVEHGGSSITLRRTMARFVAVGKAGAWSVSATVVWLEPVAINPAIIHQNFFTHIVNNAALGNSARYVGHRCN